MVDLQFKSQVAYDLRMSETRTSQVRLDGTRLEPTELIYKPVKQLDCDTSNDIAYIGHLKSMHVYTAGNFAHVLVHSGSQYLTPPANPDARPHYLQGALFWGKLVV